MSSHDHDLPFLTHLAQSLDEDPRANVTAAGIAEALGLSDQDAGQIAARLRRDGLIERRKAPQRLGDGALDFRLDITREGAAAANAQHLG